MHKARLEAFSDGVLAIIITIMVLDLHVPDSNDYWSIILLLPTLFSYLLSFIYVGIYWSNHHHLFMAVERVNGRILWANLHLLFWLSLVPFATAWMGRSAHAPWPTAFYGFNLLMAGVAFFILTKSLVRHHGSESKIAQALRQDRKDKVSLTLYLLALPAAFWNQLVAQAIFIFVAIMWVIPDRRIERVL
jgi:uncharacterized membrane protein